MLEKKSTHVRLTPEMHERAKTMAAIAGKDLAEYLAFILEKTLVGEWHVLSLQAKSFERLGLADLMRDKSTQVWDDEGLSNLDQQKTPVATNN